MKDDLSKLANQWDSTGAAEREQKWAELNAAQRAELKSLLDGRAHEAAISRRKRNIKALILAAGLLTPGALAAFLTCRDEGWFETRSPTVRGGKQQAADNARGESTSAPGTRPTTPLQVPPPDPIIVPEPAEAVPAVPEANQFPILGATYQLDRARFPGQIPICVTAEAMEKYVEAEQTGDQAAMKQMLVDVSTMEDFARFKKAEGCTLISSYSQATVTQKGGMSHQARFIAFPFEPMWGYYLYFGARVN